MNEVRNVPKHARRERENEFELHPVLKVQIIMRETLSEALEQLQLAREPASGA